MSKTVYLVIERYKNKDSVYRRFWDKGEMLPDGLLVTWSWDDDKLEMCYQLMETARREQFDEWMLDWSDVIDFEIYPLRNVRKSLKALRVCAAGRSPAWEIWLMMRMYKSVILGFLTRCSNRVSVNWWKRKRTRLPAANPLDINDSQL